MDPYSLNVLLREYHRVRDEEDRWEHRRIRDAALDANEVTVERALQGRLAAAVSRLRERWPWRSPRASRPMEPSGA
jgi:hypothetical protein